MGFEGETATPSWRASYTSAVDMFAQDSYWASEVYAARGDRGALTEKLEERLGKGNVPDGLIAHLERDEVWALLYTMADKMGIRPLPHPMIN